MLSVDLYVSFVSPQVAVPQLCDAAAGADLLVFVVPHQFIRKLCDEMLGCVSTKARGITLIKVIMMALKAHCTILLKTNRQKTIKKHLHQFDMCSI